MRTVDLVDLSEDLDLFLAEKTADIAVAERLALLAEARATARSLKTRGGVPGQAARGLEATNSLVQPA